MFAGHGTINTTKGPTRKMKKIKYFLIHCTVFTCTTTTIPAMSTEIGIDFGKQLMGNTNLEQYEVFVREPLSFKRQTDSGLKVSSAVESGIKELQ